MGGLALGMWLIYYRKQEPVPCQTLKMISYAALNAL